MKKTANGLVEYCKAQLGRPYWYGTHGQAASKPLYNYLKKEYPKYYGWEYAGEVAKVHDCCGLIKGYLWCDSPEDLTPAYNELQDISANMMRDISACDEISTIPDVPGVMVFYTGHCGVYIGGGEVIEARGHKYGVVKTKLADRPWKWWGYCPYLSYDKDSDPELVKEKTTTIALPVLKKGAKCEPVRKMQQLLMADGYEMRSASGKVYKDDGSFGSATEQALKAYQADNDLEADGSCGHKTWSKLLGL